MRIKIMMLFSLLAINIGLAQTNKYNKITEQKTKIFEYKNPITRDSMISMRDHFIIKVNKKWYCVGTSEPVWTGPNPGVRMLVSDDLVN